MKLSIVKFCEINIKKPQTIEEFEEEFLHEMMERQDHCCVVCEKTLGEEFVVLTPIIVEKDKNNLTTFEVWIVCLGCGEKYRSGDKSEEFEVLMKLAPKRFSGQIPRFIMDKTFREIFEALGKFPEDMYEMGI